MVQNSIQDGQTATQLLPYHPPYDWHGVLAFLKKRELKGVEWVTDDFYARTVHLSGYKGWIKISHAEDKNALVLEYTDSLTPVHAELLRRVNDLFDLNAHPDIISQHLGKYKILSASIKSNPGLRVPGAFHGFELGLRAILGQQVTVKAATTIAGRLVAALGEPHATPFPELSHLTPAPEKLACASVDDIAKHGIVSARCKSIIALAKADVLGELSLEDITHQNPDVVIERLVKIPGIGPWTAHYIAMRVLRWADAFPKGDVVILNNLGGLTAKQADALSQVWKPWRSYAVLHIWNMKTAG